MSHTRLIEPEEASPFKIQVEINLEDKERALEIAEMLDKFAKEVERKLNGTYCWVNELAKIIREH